MKKVSISIVALLLAFTSCTVSAFADGGEQSLRTEVEALRNEVKELRKLLKSSPQTSSVSDQETKAAIDKLSTQVKQASSWQNTNSKVHLAGYADFGYTDEERSDGTFNVGKFAPIFHYLYRDLVMLESELEFEIEDDGSTNTNLEYLALDLFLDDNMTLVGGKFLSPVGQFRQNLHPSWINKLPSAPIGFGHDQAAPTDSVGMQLRGGFPVGETRFNYAVFVGNGPEFEGGEEDAEEEDGHDEEEEEEDSHDDDAEPLLFSSFTRSVGHSGSGFELETSPTDNNSNKVFGGRLGFLPIPNFEIGLSGATGDAFTTEGDRDYDVYGADMVFQHDSAELRGEYVMTSIGPETGESEDFDLEAWYLQLAYKLPFYEKVEPVVRWGRYDSPEVNRRQWSLGVNYLFTSSLIGKVAYDISDNDGTEDIDRFTAQLAYGF